MKKRIFIVDDDPQIGRMYLNVLRRDGYEAQSFSNPTELLEHIDAEGAPDVILADMMMPNMNGIELLDALRERDLVGRAGNKLEVLIMTGHSSVQSAVEAMRRGAFHYLQKPVNLEEMRQLLKKALEVQDTKEELAEIKSERRAKYPITGILGESDPICRVRETIRTLGDAPRTTVLISGETGTGKNHVAKTLHYNSPYSKGRFMEINCAALPDNLLEAELFGYEKGAFTDARDSKQGLLEIADGGTVFLDEIDSMSMALQAKLLSFLESRVFRRLGGVEDIRVTTRVICATNANLESRVANKEFRKDLFFRINVVNLRLPALRKMGRDVLLIADSLIKQFNKDLNRQVTGFTEDGQEKLVSHSWPGNVRELRNVLERAMIFTQADRIAAKDLQLAPPGGLVNGHGSDGAFRFQEDRTLEELEHSYILHTLQKNNASYAEIADTLGISKKTLWEKRKRYNLDEKVDR